MNHVIHIGLLFASCLTTSTLAAKAESARKLLAKGNEAYRAGRFEEAVAAYEKASKASPESPQVWFNLGDARYRMGDFTNAAAAFERASVRAEEAVFGSRIQHNLGNSFIREAERLHKTDLEKALTACEQSISHFERALGLDGECHDAAENLEIARDYLKRLQAEIRQRKEEKQREQNSKPDLSQSNQNQSTAQGAQSSASQQDTAANAPGNSQRSISSQSSSAQLRRNQSGLATLNQVRVQSEQVMQQIRQRQQALRQSLQSQLQFGNQMRFQTSWSSSFSFQFGSMPNQSRGFSQPRPTEPLTDQPQDILNEEKENRRMRNQYKSRATEPSVEKDW